MPLTHPKAQDVARILCALRPDFPARPVMSKLCSPDLVGYTDLQIVTAAFMAANDPQAKTIQVIAQKLEDLTAEQTWGSAPVAQPTVSPFPVSAVPRQPVAVLPVKARRCAAHSWESAGACGACRSEILSGMRAEADYGNPDAHLAGESDEAA